MKREKDKRKERCEMVSRNRNGKKFLKVGKKGGGGEENMTGEQKKLY
jgi:hypothetical protein